MRKEEAKRKIENWLSKIPKSERNIPYFKIGDRLVSPEEAMDELEDKPKESKIMGGKKSIADVLVDKLDPETDTPLIDDNTDDIIKEQIRLRYESLPEEYKAKPLFGKMGLREIKSAKDIMNSYDTDEEIRQNHINYYHRIMRRLEDNG